MIGGFLVVVVGITVLIVVPTVVVAVLKGLTRVVATAPVEPPPALEVEARLRRIEDAIDAMAQEIERLRSLDRYVSSERRDVKLLPTPVTPPRSR